MLEGLSSDYTDCTREEIFDMKVYNDIKVIQKIVISYSKDSELHVH